MILILVSSQSSSQAKKCNNSGFDAQLSQDIQNVAARQRSLQRELERQRIKERKEDLDRERRKEIQEMWKD